MMKQTLPLLLASAFVLGACTTTRTETFANDTRDDMNEALTTPVADVGLEKIDIPTYLAEMEDPYAFAPGNCASAQIELAKLDELLGADLDVPEDEDLENERMLYTASGTALSSVIIPFRGVVREVTGAATNERRAREAYQRGIVRRGYVKGLAKSMDCNFID